MRLLPRAVRRPVCLLGLLAACGAPQERTAPPLVVTPEPAPKAALRGRAEAVFAAMSNEEKAGQLFVSWIRADADEKERARIASFVKDVGLGGVILSLGSVEQAASVVEQMQANAKTPLLVAGDFEAGVAFRLTGATQMGNQMLVGASGLERLSRAMGRVTGEEARALGAPWVLAPVLDVNSNPNNPIINVRSFGEDQEFVARMGAAFVEGVERDASALACGKHFPGHGDVDTDSHLDLPTVPGSGDLLRARELPPFSAAFRSGLSSVMTGHLSVPGLGEDPATPATLSPMILGGVLRGELGFSGLIVTDALDMGGVKNKIAPGEVAVRAILAGADVLMMPPDPYGARKALMDALASGRLPQARLDEAVLRILRTKERLEILDGSGRGPLPDWRARVGNAANAAVAYEIAQRGMTLVRDARGLVPIRDREPWLLVTVRDKELLGGGAPEGDRRVPVALAESGIVVREEITVAGDSAAEQVAEVSKRIASESRVLLAMHVRVRSHSGRIGLPSGLAPVLDALRKVDRVVAVSFGSPYLASELKDDAAFLCAYASTVRTADAAANALAGKAAITGRLPVSIPGVAPRGHGLTVLPGVGLRSAKPSDEGLPDSLPADLRAILEDAVKQRVTPGAVCLVARRGAVVAEVAVGKENYDAEAKPVTLATRYDLASLTKVCATTPAVLALVSRGLLSLDDPVQKWLPEFRGVGKERVTVRHLLAHTAGLPAYERYYRTLSGKDAIVAAAAREGLMTEPGARVVYSDLGLILTMAIVERCSNQSFETFCHDAVFAMLEMDGATFVPGTSSPIDAAATEVNDERGGLVRGRVHDENAFAMGGVSGHAGLFGTARDVARLGVAMLARGRGAVAEPVIAAMLTQQAQVGSNRFVGFDVLEKGGIGGAFVAQGSFGHTGFTGTSLLCDPSRDLCVVLLTNRVHPTRVNDAIKGLRQRVHDAVLSAAR